MGWGAALKNFSLRIVLIFASVSSSEMLSAKTCDLRLASIPSDKEHELIKIAQSLYSPYLQYHNFDHVLDVLDAAQDLVSRVRRTGLNPDWEVIFYAILFHDAGYIENHRALGFETKEAYAAYLAEKHLKEFEFPQEKIKRVISCIRATDRKGSFDGLEEKIVRAADLAGLADPYEKFFQKSERLLMEHVRLHKDRPTQIQWKEMVALNLMYYLRQHIQLTGDYYNSAGDSDWHKRVDDNLNQFLRERIW